MNHSDKATALYTRVSIYDVNKKPLATKISSEGVNLDKQAFNAS